MKMEEMKNNEKWIDALREKLNDYSEPAPASGWEQLERQLRPSVEKRIYPYRRWAVAAAVTLIVAASSLSLYFLGTPAADEIRHTSVPALAVVPDVLPEPSLPDVQLTETEPVKQLENSPINNARVLAKAEKRAPVFKEEVTPVADTDDTSVPEEAIAMTGEESATEKEVMTPPVEKKREVRRPSGRDKLHLPQSEKSAPRKGKWSVGLSVGNGGGTSMDGGELDYTPTPQRVSLMDVANDAVTIPADKELVFEEGVPYLRAPSPEPEIEHHLPVSVGISVRKSLPKGFSIETGLTYTLLSSDIKVAGMSRIESQKLHYLGIPVRANWNFFDKKHFTLYVSGGGMVEKCVYGKVAGEKVNVRPLQLSVMGAVGAQYNATRHIGIYVEPGVAYFFDDDSRVQTIRKETPFNFNLQGGIRFTY